MKKLISIILSVLLSFNVFNIASAQSGQYTEEKIQEALEVLKILDIISDDYTKETVLGQEVTRAEFAYYAVKLVKLPENNDSIYFYDVPESHWAFMSINTLASTGIVNGYGDHMFMPDKNINITEAMTVLLKLMGYSSEYFNVNGLFNLANELDLLKDFKGSNILNFEDMLILLRNALECNLCERVFGADVSYRIGTETLLSRYYDCYFEKGFLSGASQISIYGDSLRENLAVIDGVEYNCSIDSLEDYLGEELFFMYREKGKDDTPEILWFQSESKDNDVLKLGLGDDKYYNAEKNVLTYSLENEKRSRSVNLASDMMIVYNGELYNDADKVLNAEKYTVKLSKFNGSSSYNLVIVEEYFNMVVSGIDLKEQCIYDNTTGRKVSLNADDYDRVSIYDESGIRIQFEKLAVDDCVSIYCSPNNKIIKALVSKQKISGTVSSVENIDDKMVIEINQNKYTAYPDSADLHLVKVGEEILLYLDEGGYIAKAQKNNIAVNAAFLLKIYMDDLNETATVRLFTSTGECRDFEVANKLRINGITIAGADIADILSSEQLILYKLNKDNKITEFDTATPDGKLRQLTTLTSALFKGKSGRINDKTIISKNALIFSVPNDLTNAEADEFSIRQYSDFVTDQSYNTESYTVSGTDGATEILVVKGKEWGAAKASTGMILVDGVHKALNADDELTYVISGIRGSARIEVVTEDLDVLENKNIGTGDLINCVMNSKGNAKSVDIIYDADVTENLTGGSLYAQSRVITAYINEMNDNILKIGYNSHQDYDEKWNCEGIPVLIYDSGLRKNSVQLGTTADLRNLAVTNDYSKILIQSCYGEAVEIIIYK